MRGDVDPPALLADAQSAQDPVDRPCCASTGTGTSGASGRAAASATSGGSAAPAGRRPPARAPSSARGRSRPAARRRDGRRRRDTPHTRAQREVALERGREEGEVRAGARLLPHRLALGRRLDPRGGEIGRDAALAIPVAPRHAHDVAVDVAQVAVGFDLLQPRADVVAGRALVREALQRAELLRPRLRRRPAASSCADPRPPGGRARRGRPARPAARAGTRGRTSATGYAPRPDRAILGSWTPPSTASGPRSSRGSPGSSATTRRPTSPRPASATRPTSAAACRRCSRSSARRSAARSRSFASSATCASRPPGRRRTRRGPTACCTASADRRPPSTRELSAQGLYAGTGYHQLARDQLERFRTAVVDDRSRPAARRPRRRGAGRRPRRRRREPAHRAARLPARPPARRAAAPQGAGRGPLAAGHERASAATTALEHVASTWRAAEPLNAWLDEHVGPSTSGAAGNAVSRGERRDSNPRPPGPQPGSSTS